MPILNIAPIDRAGSHVIICLSGPSGGGKTRTAIEIARGLVGPTEPIGFLDTETGRGKHHAAHAKPCQYAELTPPFSPDRYIQAINEFESTGIKALIIDSGSHEFEGIGGILEMAEQSTRKDYGKWAAPKAKHKKFMARLLQSRMHLIICCRARQPLREETTADGKKEIIIGDWVPTQEKSFVYEVTVSITLRPDGTRKITKCPAELLPAFPDAAHPKDWLTKAAGEFIAKWVAGGEPINHAFEELRRAGAIAAERGTPAFREWWNTDAVKAQRHGLQQFLDNFKSIAKHADEEIAAEAAKVAESQAEPVADASVRSVASQSPSQPATPAADSPAADPTTAPVHPPADFWSRDDLAVTPPQRAGKLTWQAWDAQMRETASTAPDDVDLNRLDVDNSAHWEAYKDASPKAYKLLRDFFAEQRDQLRTGV